RRSSGSPGSRRPAAPSAAASTASSSSRDLDADFFGVDFGSPRSTIGRMKQPLGRQSMTKLRVHAFGISLDGYGAGPRQSLENPLGVGGLSLHQWVFPTRTFQKIHGSGEGTTGLDDDFMARGFEKIGSWILGRNMFATSRGPWTDDGWKGWWGPN